MVFVSCLEMGAGLTSFTLTSAIVWFNKSSFAIVWWFICNSVMFDGIASSNQVGAAPGRTLNLDLVSFYFWSLFPFLGEWILVVFLLLNFQPCAKKISPGALVRWRMASCWNPLSPTHSFSRKTFDVTCQSYLSIRQSLKKNQLQGRRYLGPCCYWTVMMRDAFYTLNFPDLKKLSCMTNKKINDEFYLNPFP